MKITGLTLGFDGLSVTIICFMYGKMLNLRNTKVKEFIPIPRNSNSKTYHEPSVPYKLILVSNPRVAAAITIRNAVVEYFSLLIMLNIV